MFDRIYRSLGLRIGAFEQESSIYYAVFETIEINQCKIHPCVAFGTHPTIIAWLFSAMARCEAGLTRDADGHRYDPRAYYWRVINALKAPKRLFDQPIFLDAGSGPEGSIPRSSDIYYDGDTLPWAAEQLRRHGMDGVVEQIRTNRVAVLSLHTHAKVLSEIFGFDASHRHIAPWRAIEPQGDNLVDETLAPKLRTGPRPGRIKPPRWIDLGTGGLTALCSPRMGALVGDRHEVLCQYIARMAPRLEVVHAEWGLDAIDNVRKHLEGHPEWPDGDACILTIDRKALRGMVRFTPIVNRVLDTLRGQAVLDGSCIRAPLSLFRERGLVNLLPDLSFALDVRVSQSACSVASRAA